MRVLIFQHRSPRLLLSMRQYSINWCRTYYWRNLLGSAACVFFLIRSISMPVSSGGTTVTVDAARDVKAMAILAPMLHTGNVYYLRCQIQSPKHHRDLFIGVTTVTSPAIVPEDAGWKGSSGLSARQWRPIPHWLGWQETQQYLFKVDLIANTLSFRCSQSQQELQLVINHASKTPLFFCLFCQGHGTKVKLLPVLSHDVQDF